jgi:DNA polymerase-3 subunit beta
MLGILLRQGLVRLHFNFNNRRINMNITINTDIFAAASLFRGVEDIRYYLNGLYLETGAFGARLVGCDGHQLAVAKLDGWFPNAVIIIPGSLVAAVKPKAKGPQQVTLEFKEGSQSYKKSGADKGAFIARDITLTFGDITTTAKELEGKYPEYRRVVPSEVSNTIAQFDPKLVSRLDKACATLGFKHFCGIAHNGDSSALSVFNEDFLVVTMPFKGHPGTTAPAWVQEPVSEPEVVRLAA